MMLVHLIGDLHQPLHVAGRDYGGTRFATRFDGHASTLHSVWDYQMIEKRVRDDFDYSIPSFLRHLVSDVVPGLTVPPCQRPHQLHLGTPKQRSVQVCPEEWAVQTNKIDCSGIVWPENHEMDLGGEYYRRGIVEQEKQMAMAGLRIAGVLASIFKDGEQTATLDHASQVVSVQQ